MGLSANTLFHFSKKLEHLVDILCNGFTARYSLEDVLFEFYGIPEAKDAPLQSAIPIVSFCDIRLTQTKLHTEKYGLFILGMSKQWGIERQITPVNYYYEESLTAILHGQAYYYLRNLVNNTKHINLNITGSDKTIPLSDILKISLSLLQSNGYFFKKISGKQLPNGKDDIDFYNEREWRYIPSFFGSQTEDRLLNVLWPREFSNKELVKEREERVKLYTKLLFNEDNIKYIVLPNENFLDAFRIALDKNGCKLNRADLFSKIRFYNKISENH